MYETNFFEDVSVNFLNGNLLISVVESPIIDSVEFSGIKAEKIKNNLNSFINLKSRSSYNEFLISEDRRLIKTFLRNIGYYFADVNTIVEDIGNNLVKIIHKIELGKKPKLKRLVLLR